MASTINASLSSGLIQAADTSGTLALQTGNTTALTIDNSQNVGIGTASPAAKLDVRGSSTFLINSSNPTAWVSVDSGLTTHSMYTQFNTSSTAGTFGTYTSDPLAFVTGNNERMRINSSGQVLINTTNATTYYNGSNQIYPNALIQGDYDTLYLAGYTTNPGLNFAGPNSASNRFRFAAIQGAFTTTTAGSEAGALLFETSNGGSNIAERMRIDSSGNLLVGTTTAYAKTTILGSGTTSGGTALSVKDSNATDLFYVRNDGLIVTGARTTSPYNNTTGSAANLYVDSGGTLSRSTSSLKYKKNIQDANFGLTDLLKLRAVTYEGKAEQDAGKTFGGLIAEEVHEAGLTEFVQYATDGTPDALSYGNMVALCVKAIQELKALVDTQATEIAALQAKVGA
jgi:hypothetical protein